MATVPVTGLSALGNVFSNLGSQIGAQRRQDELNARARQLQLEDREAAIRENDRLYGRQRRDAVLDRESQRSREDALYEQRREDQVGDRDEARTYAEAAAIRERARMLAERAPFEANLQTTVDNAARELSVVRSAIQKLTRIEQTPSPQISPNDPIVVQRAQAMANGSRNREEIAAYMQKAYEEIQTKAFLDHASRIKDAQIAIQGLRASEAQMTGLIREGIGKNVAPSIKPPDTISISDSAEQTSRSAPRQASAQDIAAAVSQALGVNQTSGSGGGPTSPVRDAQLFANPENNAGIAAGNAEIAARGAAMLQAESNNVTRRLSELDSELQAPAPSMPTLGMGFGGYSVGSVSDPIAGARSKTALLQEKAALQNRKRQLDAQLLGPTVGAATPPALSSPTSSTPAVPFAAPAGRWWETVAPTN